MLSETVNRVPTFHNAVPAFAHITLITFPGRVSPCAAPYVSTHDFCPGGEIAVTCYSSAHCADLLGFLNCGRSSAPATLRLPTVRPSGEVTTMRLA